MVQKGFNDLASFYPALAKDWDAEKNGALSPEAVTPASNRKAWWKCPLGHSYSAVISSRALRGSDCPYCAGSKALAGFNDLAAKAPDVAAQWHPTLNGNLTPEMVTSGSHRRVWWQCPLGHTWKAFVYSRTGAQRCGCAGTAGKSCTADKTCPAARRALYRYFKHKTYGGKSMKKRILSLLLILCMAVTLLPTAVFAEDATGTSSAGGTIYVDAVNGNDSNENVGQSWETAYKTLETAVTAAKSGDTIMLSAAKYTLYGISSTNTTKGKDLTFVGQGADKTGWNIGATVPDPANFGTEYNGDYSFDGAGTIKFEQMTLQSSKADYLGFIRAGQTVVEDCTINGKTFYWGYTSAMFKDTTFNCPSGDYAVWTYSSPTMTFDHCTFNSSGKVINVFTDYGAGKNDIIVNFKGCTVNNTGKSLKPVLNINDSNMGNFKYILNISGNTTVTGVDVDKDTCSRLFGFGGKAASNNKGKTVVNFGDTTVWEDGKMVDAKAYHTDGVTVDGVTYDNDVAGANDILYAEGYKDNKVETTATDWAEQEDGSYTRTVTRKCNYCDYKEETTEIDWNVPKSIIAAACLNTKDHYSYLIGYSDGTVRPNGRITRAEVATIFFRLLTDDARQRNWSSENNFSDVSADKWYNNAVSTLCHMGVLGGYSDGTFRPNAPITRAEFAKIAVSFSQANGSAVYSYFTDVKTTDWFAPYVTAAKDSGLIEGYSDGSFKPENRITRAEACAIVNRVLGRKPSKNHMKISGRIDWPDCTTADWFYEAIMEATNSHTYQMGKRVETWNGKLPQRDWAALENNWASAYTGKGGEVH